MLKALLGFEEPMTPERPTCIRQLRSPPPLRTYTFGVSVETSFYLCARKSLIKLPLRVIGSNKLFFAVEQWRVVRAAVVTPLDAESSEIHGDGRPQRWMWIAVELRVGQVRDLSLPHRQLHQIGMLDGAGEYAPARFIDT